MPTIHPTRIDDFCMNQTLTHTFEVSGITCGHCEKAVICAVRQVDANGEVTIDRAANRVEVASQQPREQPAKAIAEAGYEVA